MGLFDIFKGRKPKEDKKEKPAKNLLIPSILDKWSYNRELSSGEDYSQFLNAYRDVVYTCAQRNATAVASANLRLYVAKPNSKVRTRFLTKPVETKTKDYICSQSHLNLLPCVRKAVDFDEVLSHPVLDLLQKVNNFMTFSELMERTTLFEELCGNAFWMLAFNKLQIPVEIWPMQPDKVKIIPDEKNFISGYLYGSSFDNVKFKEEEIIHHKYVNPKSMYYGSGPLAAIRSAYNLTQSMYEYEIATFLNMGRVEGYWKVKESLDESEFARLKQELADSTQGVKNANKSILVDNDMEYKYISITPREMAYLSGKENLRAEIMMAFGQNESLYDKGSTRANAEAAIYQHMKNTIKPRCQKIEERLNEKLLPWYDDNLLFVYEDMVPQDKELMIRERESNIKNGLTTINEERKKMRMSPITGGDEVFMQMQMVPLSTVLRGDNLKK